jgi:outer membrane protein assembly factor BamB
MLALDSGQIWWAHDMSSYRGLAVQGEDLYVTQSDGTVVALRERDGSETWRNDTLKRRGLSVPVVLSSAVVVADYQGYVHWLDRKTGWLVAREKIGKWRVSNPPVAVGDTVIVLTDGGDLAALRADPSAAKPPQPPPPPKPDKKKKHASPPPPPAPPKT